jgi:hypothetical protein
MQASIIVHLVLAAHSLVRIIKCHVSLVSRFLVDIQRSYLSTNSLGQCFDQRLHKHVYRSTRAIVGLCSGGQQSRKRRWSRRRFVLYLVHIVSILDEIQYNVVDRLDFIA